MAEVATAKKRIELQGQEMGAATSGSDPGQRGVVQGREDLARAALERRAMLEGQVGKLQKQYASLERQTSQLQERERRLTDQVGAFRIEKETIKATYTASEAQVRANEAVSGMSNTITEVGTSLDRARDRVAQMQARAAATDELLASGALTDLTAAPDADIERQLGGLGEGRHRPPPPGAEGCRPTGPRAGVPSDRAMRGPTSGWASGRARPRRSEAPGHVNTRRLPRQRRSYVPPQDQP